MWCKWEGVAICDEVRRSWGNEGCVGDTWIVVGES